MIIQTRTLFTEILRKTSAARRKHKHAVCFVYGFFGDESASVILRYRKKKSKQRLIKIEFLIKDLELSEFGSDFILPVEKIQDAYAESTNETDYIDVMEMLENDGLEFISFSKSLF